MERKSMLANTNNLSMLVLHDSYKFSSSLCLYSDSASRKVVQLSYFIVCEMCTLYLQIVTAYLATKWTKERYASWFVSNWNIICQQRFVTTLVSGWELLPWSGWSSASANLDIFGQIIVLSSFGQCSDVSKRGCSELSSLGAHSRQLQTSVTKCRLCRALLCSGGSPQQCSSAREASTDVSNSWEFYWLLSLPPLQPVRKMLVWRL